MTSHTKGHIRSAILSDLPEIIRIESLAHTYPWPDNTLHWAITQPLAFAHILEIEGQLAGYALFEQVLDEATLLNITIHPDHQLKGLGRELLLACLDRLNPNILRIFLEVRASNQAARKLYARCDFVETGIRKAYYPADQQREDAIVMTHSRMCHAS